ncbi:hypothetical protein E9531_06175 [Lampropedia puyangensis]|uniref:Anti sigma-E protein RseA N-terminal domain-containing protein n=1 Tax=Lampropedia puyangensis TaxID=1330072 RepID=A0A4S8F8E9_9BURK|nr:RseA family anti-sigma factor [Lampropedia puyangensis]THU03760.1 hypothetical protein E9531_06175 [Lampropedia puyangensis]
MWWSPLSKLRFSMQVQHTPPSSPHVKNVLANKDMDNSSLELLLSALADGELSDSECDRLMQSLEAQNMSNAVPHTSFPVWETYQIIGECLRAPGQNHAAADSAAFLHTFRQRLAAEPAVKSTLDEVQALQPAPQLTSVTVTGSQAANASIFRWKMVAGFASLAAVAAIGWNGVAGLTGGGAGQAVQLASSNDNPSVVVPEVASAVMPMPSPNVIAVANRAAAPTFNQDAQNPTGIVIRDPKLDEILSRQYGNTVALQPPAAFLRNASANGSVAN